jgi:hypothetical protein
VKDTIKIHELNFGLYNITHWLTIVEDICMLENEKRKLKGLEMSQEDMKDLERFSTLVTFFRNYLEKYIMNLDWNTGRTGFPE